MNKVDITATGNILVEMTPKEWHRASILFKSTDDVPFNIGEELVKYRRKTGVGQEEGGPGGRCGSSRGGVASTPGSWALREAAQHPARAYERLHPTDCIRCRHRAPPAQCPAVAGG